MTIGTDNHTLQAYSMGITPEQKLKSMGLSLPERPPVPVANFENTVCVGSLIFISGQGPVLENGELLTGKVGRDVTTEEAYGHARIVGLNLLAAIRWEIHELSRIRRVVKLLGMVNAVPDYEDHSKVINGCSDLLCEVMGQAGLHSRSAIGVGSLPNNISVEVEAIVEVNFDV